MKKTLALALALVMVLCSFAVAEDAAKPTYTYNSGLTDFPTNWSPLQNQTAADNDILDFIGPGYYSFDYNENFDGYKIVPNVAADFPIDVTADYVGDAWNIKEGDTARAWKVPLRDNLKWQDGTPIVAQDFEYSYEMLLAPNAQNHRADTAWSGSMKIMGAQAYAKQNSTADASFRDYMGFIGAETMEDFLAAVGAEKGFINWNNSYGDTYDFEAKAWTGAAEDAVVETPLTVKELYDFFVTGEGAVYADWADEATKMEWAYDELFAKYTYPAKGFETVGVKAVSDYELVFIIEQPLEGFYLWYSLTDGKLINKALYEANATDKDGVYTNTYGTSVETTISYGPYMLTAFQSDKEYILEKNPNWFGWDLPQNEGLYKTDRMVVTCVKEISTRVEMFLNGHLDVVGLDKNYIGEYSTSEYCYFDEGDSVFAMVFNPSLTALTANQTAAGENINKTIITIKDFRIAMSLGMDRAAFCAAAQPINQPALALYGGQIVADPDNGIFYRTTKEAKQVVADFWGMADEIGEGKMYATVDDAIDSITGYNLEMAREYFNKAYDEAIAQGLMDEDDVVQIMVGTPNATSAFYNSGYDYIVKNYTDAVVGTKLEGKLTFTRDATLGNNFGNALRNNQVDMLFGVGWTGSTFDPYGLMEAYVSPTYQYDRAWDTKTSTAEITLDGVAYTGTIWDWYEAMNGKTIEFTKVGTAEKVGMAFPYSTDAHEAQLRIEVLAALENEVLQHYDFIPLMGDSAAKLKGMKIKYFMEDEVFPMGRGGVKYMDYNYNDAEWAAFVTEQGGTLNYK